MAIRLYLPMLASWMDLMMDKRAEVCSFLKLRSLQKSTAWTYNSSRTPLFGSGRSTPNTLHKALSQKRREEHFSALSVCVIVYKQIDVFLVINRSKKPLQVRHGLHFVQLLHVMVAYISPENTQGMDSGLDRE